MCNSALRGTLLAASFTPTTMATVLAATSSTKQPSTPHAFQPLAIRPSNLAL